MIQRNGKPEVRLVNGELLTVIAAARNGSVPALGALLHQYHSELLTLAESELGSTIGPKASASDIVQDALLDAVRDFNQFQGRTDEELRAWLRQIVRNRSIDVTRRYRDADKRNVGREVRLDELLQNELAASDLTPSAQVSADDVSKRMLAVVDCLPEPHRSILQLRHQDGKTFAEIGVAQQCSPFRARRAWYEALLMLQHQLKEQA